MTHNPLERVVQLLAEMPGIGKKTAQRLAYFVLNRDNEYAFHLADGLRELKEQLRWCTRCYNISHEEICGICRQEKRDRQVLCVVEDAADVAHIERSGGFTGSYHVLQGVLSPVNGIGPAELRIKELFKRLAEEEVREVILATNPTVEGEATAMYLADALVSTGITISRIGVGIPIGTSLDFCDDITMAKAFEHRRFMNQHES